jgi:hypothetical protein
MTRSNPFVPGHLRKMRLGEFDQLLDLLEVAFAEDSAREGRNFRDDMVGVQQPLPIFKMLVKVWPSLEDRFTTFVWDAGDRFASAVIISSPGCRATAMK